MANPLKLDYATPQPPQARAANPRYVGAIGFAAFSFFTIICMLFGIDALFSSMRDIGRTAGLFFVAMLSAWLAVVSFRQMIPGIARGKNASPGKSPGL